MTGRRPRRSSLEEVEVAEGEKLMADHREFDDRGGGGRENVGCRELPLGSHREERGGCMVGWGCQQRKEEKIRLGFRFEFWLK